MEINVLKVKKNPRNAVFFKYASCLHSHPLLRKEIKILQSENRYVIYNYVCLKQSKQKKKGLKRSIRKRSMLNYEILCLLKIQSSSGSFL
jgi:hypothetical protein